MKVVKYIAFFALMLAIGGGLLLSYSWYENLDPQGETNIYCKSVELPRVLNNSGMVVTAHNTVCDLFGGNSAVYVYVHKLGESESKKSLVFRYSDKPLPYPKFEWVNDSSLRISVGDVNQVTKQLNTIEGIKITYVIGKEEYPRKN